MAVPRLCELVEEASHLTAEVAPLNNSPPKTAGSCCGRNGLKEGQMLKLGGTVDRLRKEGVKDAVKAV